MVTRTEYAKIHNWLRQFNKEKNLCERCGDYRELQFALIYGKQHAKKRKNYMVLCFQCHRKYDKEREQTVKKGKYEAEPIDEDLNRVCEECKTEFIIILSKRKGNKGRKYCSEKCRILTYWKKKINGSN